jgi:hypothetical protein
MPRTSKGKGGRGSQLKGNNVKPGTAAPSALTGKDTNKWNVTGEAKRMAEAQMDRTEPFLETPLKGDVQSFPAIYGVDLKEKRRQGLLKDIGSGALQEQIGNRQVMLDDKTIDWIIREQDRIYMIERDMIFEASAKQQGLFDNPAGLEYLHKINPGYFSRRRKMAKWLVKTQLKLFDIAMDGVANESDFDFMLMIQSLPEEQLKLIDTPAHKLSSTVYSNEGLYQKGAFRRIRLPTTDKGTPGADNRQVPFAGFTSGRWNAGAVGPATVLEDSGMTGNFGSVAPWGGILRQATTGPSIAVGALSSSARLDSFLGNLLG